MYKRRHHPPWKCCEAISSSFMIELLFFFCFKTVSIHELSQDKSPRSTKVVSKWPKCCSIKKAEDPVINLCHLLLIVKRRPNCYTFLAESRCYSYNFQNWMLHFFYFLSEWPDACNCAYGNGRVEFNEADFDSSLPFSFGLQLNVESVQMSKFSKKRLTWLTWPEACFLPPIKEQLFWNLDFWAHLTILSWGLAETVTKNVSRNFCVIWTI